MDNDDNDNNKCVWASMSFCELVTFPCVFTNLNIEKSPFSHKCWKAKNKQWIKLPLPTSPQLILFLFTCIVPKGKKG